MLSVFTPTHKVGFLGDAWGSLKGQPGAWEWVIVPNGGAVIPAEIAADSRVRVVAAPDHVARMGVGSLKRFAVEQCKGEAFVEFDHDDALMPGALAKIQRALDDGAGFVYSDFTNLRADRTCEVYSAGFGWASYPVEGADGITAMRAFEPSAASLHRIFFCPNHVRVWSREAYFRAGGHNPNQAVVDDHDLVCRTYLAGVEFKHIAECLYVYRLHADGGQTYIQRNAEIQERQEENSRRYLHALIDEECRRKSLPRYDLGAKIGKARGYLSVDLDGADVNCDLLDGLPFADNSVGSIRAFDFLEHIPHCRDSRCTHAKGTCTVGIMNEIYRVLAPGGWLLSGTPSTDGRGAWQDPSHVSGWNPNSFWYYTRREQAKYIRGLACRFQAVRVEQSYPSAWHREHAIPYVYADLVALKGQRQPGAVEI